MLSNYFSSKEWDKRKSLEETEKVVEQVYSPLFFIFYGLPKHLGYYTGVLNTFLVKGISQKKIQQSYFRWSQEQKKVEKTSLQIINILKTKSGSICPKNFWKDLFFFSDYLKDLEEETENFIEREFKKENIPTMEKRFQNICKATIKFSIIASEILNTLKELIENKG